jgi:hypothetical protein
MSKQHTRHIGPQVLILLIGTAMRVIPLADNRFHPDEALFATLARLIVSGRDVWLSHTSLLVDKPPLLYYTLAGSMALAGGSEVAARLPGLFAGLISIALTGRLAWQYWRSATASALAMLFSALSPFGILFSPTAFADPLMIMWLLAALTAVNAARWGWGGMLFGLALATKQSALFFAPLIVALGGLHKFNGKTCWRDIGYRIWHFAVGLGLVLMLITLWDRARGAQSSFWAASFEANNPGRLARSSEVWPRALAWWGWFNYLTGHNLLSGGVAIVLATLAPTEIVRHRQTRQAATTLVLSAFLVGYLAFLWLVAFPLHDRYLLPLVPLIALLIGRSTSLLANWLNHVTARRLEWVVGAIVAIALSVSAWQAAHSGYPVGGDHGMYDGIDRVAAYLRTQPEGTVVYYDTLGWTLHYYLFDAYVYLAPFGTPAALTADLNTFGHADNFRFVVLPGWESHTEILEAIQQACFNAYPVLQTENRYGDTSFVVYRLEAICIEARSRLPAPVNQPPPYRSAPPMLYRSASPSSSSCTRRAKSSKTGSSAGSSFAEGHSTCRRLNSLSSCSHNS